MAAHTVKSATAIDPQEAQALRFQLQQEEHAKGPQAALATFEQSLHNRTAPAGLWNLAGNLAMRAGDSARAAEYFGTAARLEPGLREFAINHAIALSAAGEHHKAIAVLTPHEEGGKGDVRFCSVRANAARNGGWLDEAARWYDAALALDPQHKKALNGRARVAIERGERDALQRFESGLHIDPGNIDLYLGKAQALDVAGDVEGARTLAQKIVASAPDWGEGLRFLAQLKLASGETDFTAHYREAARKAPHNPAIAFEHITQLGGLDFHAEAAEIAASARARFANIPHFALLEAIHTGAAGDQEQAEALFAALDIATSERYLHEARHAIRQDDWDRARALLEKVLGDDPWNISAWALRDLVWRQSGDERGEWLHAQEGLCRLMPLVDAERVLPPVIGLLHTLHDGSPFPLGQSLRGGTQTRGNLFQRMEPELAALKQAIMATVEIYRDALPRQDRAHPLLRHRTKPWHMKGSWSVRLAGSGDFHTSHIHPQGMISSALYCELPDFASSDEREAGALELGRPPADLRQDMSPLATFVPRYGYLALFPSTLYHGTRPFNGHKRRLTVAFDIVAGE